MKEQELEDKIKGAWQQVDLEPKLKRTEYSEEEDEEDEEESESQKILSKRELQEELANQVPMLSPEQLQELD